MLNSKQKSSFIQEKRQISPWKQEKNISEKKGKQKFLWSINNRKFLHREKPRMLRKLWKFWKKIFEIKTGENVWNENCEEKNVLNKKNIITKKENKHSKKKWQRETLKRKEFIKEKVAKIK